MAQQKRCNVISGQESDVCTPEEAPLEDSKQPDSDEDDLLEKEDVSQEHLDPDEFDKKWDDINYLIRKQFRCK